MELKLTEIALNRSKDHIGDRTTDKAVFKFDRKLNSYIQFPRKTTKLTIKYGKAYPVYFAVFLWLLRASESRF